MPTMSRPDSSSSGITAGVHGDVALLRVVGEVDMANSDGLRDRGASLLDGAASALVLDLSEVTFFASSGIAALAHLRTCGRGTGSPKVHVVASQAVRRSLEVTAMTTLLPLHDSVDEAVGAARASLS
ncbi:STAS domain-containing protein [Actinosynnema sp. NPDC023587]|uniref:STAS domain-containing protein n=1 Tax=Actinosynnema sp. NPDC023587 TaxID=3154695 RepID=UPI0033FB379E